MLNEFLILFALTFIPFFELRFSIPVGILAGSVALPFGYSIAGFGMHWFSVFAVCVIANMILGALLYWGLDIFAKYFTQYAFFNRPYQFFVERSRKKVSKLVDKYGLIGVALFISIPLPGSGSYTGALGSHVLGLSYKKFLIANTIGVTLAGIYVTIITLASQGLFSLF